MTTINNSIRGAAFLRQALGVLASILLAAGVQAQQVSTVISTNLLDPNYVTADPNNNIYLTDSSNNRIVELVPTTNGVLTFAGLSGPAYAGSSNGTGVAARFNQPLGIVYDPYRNGLVVVDSGNQVLRFVTLSGVVTNLAGLEAPTPFIGGGLADGPAAKTQFSSFMTGIAADGAGNLFIADSGNNAIRRLGSNNIVSTVQVTNYTFNQPNAVVVDNNNNLWVADTMNDTICVISNISVISNQTVKIMAGTLRSPGTNDSLTAASALFNLPSGLLWDPNGAGLFISDTGNHTIRRLWPNLSLGGAYSVQTVAGLPLNKGFVNGALNVAQFDNPVGLAVDAVDNGYYVVDRANNALRRLQSTAPQPPVSDPAIGYVTFITPPGGGSPVSVFNPATQQTFDNAAIIAIKAENGVQTYMTYDPTPINSYVDQIATPGPKTGTSPLIYAGDGNSPSATLPSVLAPEPDVTVYAISEATGRPSSDIVSARFRFVTANPTITGNNSEVVPLSDVTSGALMYYTLDGTTPTNDGSNGIGPITNGQTISFVPITNTTLTVVAFASGFAPSGTVVQVFSPSNFVANAITFGFASGEASSEFVAAAGRRFFAPVTLSLLPGAKMYSLQFNVVLSNLLSAPPADTNYTFLSTLVYPQGTPPLYIRIPPGIVLAPGIIGTGLFTNTATDLLGVAWLELVNETNLYPADSQDLITYSLAHETLFTSASGQVVVGAYSFVIPANAPTSSRYQIQLGQPSADGDGFTQNVFIETPTNGSLAAGPVNSIKNVTVGVVPYLVGDVAPFRWFNAGDFGDLDLLNNDVLDIFRAAVYFLNRPPAGSDFFDAYDASNGGTNNLYFGDNTSIDTITNGDGVIDVSDVYVTLRRSLDTSRVWYERYWSNGTLHAQAVVNSNPTKLSNTPFRPTRQSLGSPRYVAVGADRVQGAAGQTVQVPVRVLSADSLAIKVLMFNVDVTPLDGSPTVTNTVTFTPNAGIGSPTLSLSQSADNYAGAWLSSTNAGVVGTSIIGTLSITLPPTATSNSSYAVHFEHFSASPNGIATFHSTVQDGLVTVGSARTASSWNDGIPDWWRLTYFGTISNLLSAATADADNDGASNWQEYVAGTNPMDPTSVLQLTGSLPSPNFTVQWPSVLGKTYQVQSSSSLFSTNWTTIQSNVPGTGQLLQLSDPNLPAPPARFYRVQVQ